VCYGAEAFAAGGFTETRMKGRENAVAFFEPLFLISAGKF
jgi:hypothetical protein